MKNILVVNVNWLGDVIFSTPIFRALKEHCPDARISCLAVPLVREILECVPEVNEIICYDERGAHRSLWAKWKLSRQLKQKGFDAAFLLRPSRSRAMILWAAQIPQRIGYGKKGDRTWLTRVIVPPAEDIHRSDYYLNVVESFGIKVNKRQTYLQVSVQAEKEANDLLQRYGIKTNEPFFVINPGGNWHLKRWPVKNYVELIRRMLERWQIKIVLTGAPGDRELADEIGMAVAHERLVDLIGKTDLKQLMAVMRKAQAVISADSGPLHIANSIGAKTVGLFGPTRPQITGPRGSAKAKILEKPIGCNLQACYFLECPSNLCMQVLKTEDVLRALESVTN